jgi:putative transposase
MRIRSAGRRDGDEGRAGASSLRQRARVRRQGLRKWVAGTGAKTAYIEPGSPWENGYCSFALKLSRDEFLNGEIFYSMKEIRVLTERWRVHYNTVRPHSSLGHRPPAPEAWVAKFLGYGKVETATRFPLLHTLDCDYQSTKIVALH